jgi:hypothetical protein
MRRRRRKSARRRSAQSPILRALTTSTLALPGLAGSALADSAPEGIEADYNYAHYSEDDISSGKLAPGSTSQRYEIDLHQVHLLVPVGDRWDIGLDLAYETMTGATPWYIEPEAGSNKPLQVMTGATIDDARTDVLASTNYYLTNGKVGGSAGVSIENDYLAFNGGLSGERHLREKTTTVSGGAGFSIDRITPEDADIFTERPDEEDRQRIDGLSGSLHADYNFYFDDWGVNAHTIEAAWHQSLFDLIRIIPSVRYYSQSQADFYAPFYITARSDGLRSSDYRLSPYGALSYRVKAETRFQTWDFDWIVSFGYERYTSSGKLALGSVETENPGLVSFNLFSVGLEGRF